MQKSCQTCVHFKAGITDMGTCHLYPPRFSSATVVGNPWEFPKVYQTNVCGQHMMQVVAEVPKETEAPSKPDMSDAYKFYEERNAKIVKAVETGRTYRDVGKEFGISPSRVAIIIHRDKRNKEMLKRKKFKEESGHSVYVQYSAFNINKEGYEFLMKEVEDAYFSVRTVNCLKNDNVNYVWQIFGKTEAELFRMPNFGRKSLNELKEVFAAHKFNLHDQLSESLLWHLEKGIAYNRIGGTSTQWDRESMTWR